MTNPVKSDDADEKWEGYPGHTRAKHDLVGYYLHPWFKKLSAPNRKLRVFDCFAGRGEYYPKNGADPYPLEHIGSSAEYPGSPQLLLDRAVEYSSSTREIECIFIEKKSKNVEILEGNLPSNAELPENVSYKITEGSFQAKTKEWIDKTGGWHHPTFFLIDPFGYSQLEYDLLTSLASPDRFEVLVTLMASEVVRWQDVGKHHRAIKTLFGKESWREELEQFQPEHWNDKEVGYYCMRLRENGPEHTLAYLVTEEDSKAMKYYLVFGTNHEDGLELMREAMQNCGPGEFAYAPKRPELDESQMTIGASTKEQRRVQIEEDLLDGFKGETISFDDIVARLYREDEYLPYRRKHVRPVLKSMESDGDIEVERVTSKTSRGLGGDDLITFP